MPIHDLGAERRSWRDTAAALMELDLVVAVDCSVAHPARALGRPVWICLPAAPEWRWMLERTDTPWCSSARLFRQPRVGDWSSVFEEVAAEFRRPRERSRESLAEEGMLKPGAINRDNPDN